MAESKTRDIRDAIIDILTPLQLDGEPAFTSVVGHAGDQGKEYPQVQVLPGSLDNEKQAFEQTDRTVAFLVRTYVPQTQDGSDFDQMYPLNDLIVDALDAADANNILMNGLGVYMMNTRRGEWDYVSTQSGAALFADINVEVTYSHNT